MTAPDPLRSASQHPPTWKLDYPISHAESRPQWRAWLERHHGSERGVWLGSWPALVAVPDSRVRTETIGPLVEGTRTATLVLPGLLEWPEPSGAVDDRRPCNRRNQGEERVAPHDQLGSGRLRRVPTKADVEARLVKIPQVVR